MAMDELFEKIKKGASAAGEFAARTANSASKKAGEVYNTSKHQITLFDLKNDISDLYKEIGELVYNAHKNGDDNAEAIEEKILAIEEKELKIAELKAAIDEIKDVKTCEKCGTKNEKSAAFCRKCGAKYE